jgi:purine nucleosidase
VGPTPLILDVDTGVDDALALLYACASPEVELVAATCVMGNVTIAQAVRNTLWVLELAGRSDVEVAEGAGRPLVRDHTPFRVVHGSEGLGFVTPPAPAGGPSARSAATLIVEAARARPGEVQLVATGPLTNVAIALTEEPDLPNLLRGFAIMGGAFARGGNTTPAAEANIWMDPDAAQAVFRGFDGAEEEKLPLCVGLDVTERAILTSSDLDAIGGGAAAASHLGGFLREAVPFYIDFHATTRGLDGAYMHDPLAVAAAIDPSLVTLHTTRVEVETDGRWTLGETVADLLGIRRSPWLVAWENGDNARVALDVDERAFIERFVQRLRSLVESTA